MSIGRQTKVLAKKEPRCLSRTHVMITFCRGGKEVTELFESSDTYFRELACLHGANESDVLRRSLETAFDRDEDMVFDMMSFVYGPY